MESVRRFKFMIVFIIFLSVDTSLSKDPRRNSIIVPEHRVQREQLNVGESILRRNHRQAEDSYEEGVEYEYEEEAETESTPINTPEPEPEPETEAPQESKPTEEVKLEKEREGEDEYYESYDENGNEEEGRQENTERTTTESDVEEERPEDTEQVEESETLETTQTPEADPGSPETNIKEISEEKKEQVDVQENKPEKEFEEEEPKRGDSSEDDERLENHTATDSQEYRGRTESEEENEGENPKVPEQVIVESKLDELERYKTESKIPVKQGNQNEPVDDVRREDEENGETSRSEERASPEINPEEENRNSNSIDKDEIEKIEPEDTRRDYEGSEDEEEENGNGNSEEVQETTTPENKETNNVDIEEVESTEPPREEEEQIVITTEPPRRNEDSQHIPVNQGSLETEDVQVTDEPSLEEEERINREEYEVEEAHELEKPNSVVPLTTLHSNEKDKPNEIFQTSTETTKAVEIDYIPKEILDIEDEEEEEEERYEGRRFNDKNRKDDGENSSLPESNEVTENRNEDERRDKIIETTMTELPSLPPPSPSPLAPTRVLLEEDESSQENLTFQPSATDIPEVDSSENRIFDVEEKSSSSSSVEDDLIENNKLDVKRKEIFGSRTTTTTPPLYTFSSSKEKEDIPTAKIECFTGYQLSIDGLECQDLDECTQNVCGSTQICTNLPGTYRCSCSTGFIKDFRNERICRDLNECEIGNGGCNHDCINTQGSYYCACVDGFELSRDQRTCVLKPTTTTTTQRPTTTTTTTTTTTPRPTTMKTTTTSTTTSRSSSIPTVQWRPKQTFFPTIDNIRETTIAPYNIPNRSKVLSENEDTPIRNCPTPPVPKGSGIAYLYCSRSPVGIHHRHSQLERRLIQDWTARRNRSNNNNSLRNNNLRLRNRRTTNTTNTYPANLPLKRRLRQTTYSPGSMCELRCRGGFELKGQYTLHCNAASGSWQGTTNGFCQVLPKVDNQNLGIGLSNSDTTPSNEIPRLAPNIIPELNRESDFDNRTPFFKPTFAPYESAASAFRPNFYQPPTPSSTKPSWLPYATEAPENYDYWRKPKLQIPPPVTPTPVLKTTTTTRRPYYNYNKIPASQSTTTTTTPATPTTARNSFIQLTYRFKTPWIKCPDDITIDVPLNQSLAYVIIPQPQTNVDWWRQVTSEPSWAKGLETEIGPGKYRISFRARSSAPHNNTAECAFMLEVRDSDPPRVRECPESFTVRLNPGQNDRAVNWIEPHFSDNIRITSLRKSHDTGAILTIGEHLINYEAKDGGGNQARCSFTITVLPPASTSAFGHQNNYYRKPFGTEGITSEPTTTTTSTSPKPVDTYPQSTRNVVCHVGKKGRRIVFQSKVVPRGCTEMTTDLIGDLGHGSLNTLNTVTQNSAENSATSQISSVSFSSNDNPHSSSAFSQAVSNGRNSNRQVHSASSVTNNAHGTNSRASSYAVSVSSSSRNFDTPFLTDKQVYDEDFVVPTFGPKTRSGQWNGNGDNFADTNTDNGSLRSGPAWRSDSGRIRNNSKKFGEQQEKGKEFRKYFRHFDSWDTDQSRDRAYVH